MILEILNKSSLSIMKKRSVSKTPTNIKKKKHDKLVSIWMYDNIKIQEKIE